MSGKCVTNIGYLFGVYFSPLSYLTNLLVWCGFYDPHNKLINNIKSFRSKRAPLVQELRRFCRIGEFCQVVEFHCGESATNVGTLSFFLVTEKISHLSFSWSELLRWVHTFSTARMLFPFLGSWARMLGSWARIGLSLVGSWARMVGSWARMGLSLVGSWARDPAMGRGPV